MLYEIHILYEMGAHYGGLPGLREITVPRHAAVRSFREKVQRELQTTPTVAILRRRNYGVQVEGLAPGKRILTWHLP